MYHEIAPQTETKSRLAVEPHFFAAQMESLYDDGFQTLTAQEFACAIDSRERLLPTHPVVITFDDGYADFHSRALPLLKGYGFSATVFVTTGWVAETGRRAEAAPLGRMMSWSQIHEASRWGIEFAGHSRTHPQLDRLPEPRLREELAASKLELEDRLDAAVTGVAYPFGYSNSWVRHVARQLGYSYGCAVSNTMADAGSDLLALPRLTVDRSTTMPVFRRIVHGNSIRRTYLKDHAKTKGWAVARRSMAAVGCARR